MGCWHGWHGCGPWYGPPYEAGRYGPVEWYEEWDRPLRGRQRRRSRRRDREATTEELEARLADLRDEIGRIESELSELRGGEDALAEGP